MTKREQRLLCIALAALALVVDLRLLLLPVLEEQRALKEEFQALTEKQETYRLRIQTLDYIDEAIAGQEAALLEASAPYYPVLTTEEMDGILTDLLLSHGFFPRELKLEEGRSGAAAPYLAKAKKTAGTFYDGVALSSLAESGSPEDIAAKGKQYLYAATVRFAAHGGDWLALLDDVAEDHPGIRVTGFELTDDTVEGTVVLSMCEK